MGGQMDECPSVEAWTRRMTYGPYGMDHTVWSISYGHDVDP